MFDKLRAALRPATKEDEKPSIHEDHHIAVTALLIEAATLDGIFDEVEKSSIAKLIADKFDFDASATALLIETAEDHHKDSVEIFGFTRRIKDEFDENGRIELIEMLWEVVYADDHLHDYEANLLRRVAGLLHVTDRASGEAKNASEHDLVLTGRKAHVINKLIKHEWQTATKLGRAK